MGIQQVSGSEAAHERCKMPLRMSLVLELSAKRWRGKAVEVRLMYRVQGPHRNALALHLLGGLWHRGHDSRHRHVVRGLDSTIPVVPAQDVAPSAQYCGPMLID